MLFRPDRQNFVARLDAMRSLEKHWPRVRICSDLGDNHHPAANRRIFSGHRGLVVLFIGCRDHPWLFSGTFQRLSSIRRESHSSKSAEQAYIGVGDHRNRGLCRSTWGHRGWLQCRVGSETLSVFDLEAVRTRKQSLKRLAKQQLGLSAV